MFASTNDHDKEHLKLVQDIGVCKMWNYVVLHQMSWKNNTNAYSSAAIWGINFTTYFYKLPEHSMNYSKKKNHSLDLFKISDMGKYC